MSSTVQYRFLLRRGTAADLAAVNEVPLEGELVLETDTKLGKVGNGATHYNDLPYSLIGGVDLTGLANANVLAWDSASGLWKPVSASGGGSASLYSYSPPAFSQVASLLHFEGADGSTAIADQVSGNVWTAGGGAKISTAWSAFGSSSLKAPSSLGNSAISLPTNSGFNVGSGDWTLEFRYKYIGIPDNTARFFQTRDGDVYAGIALTSSGSTQDLLLYLSSTGSSFDILNGATVMTLPKSSPASVLVERSGDTILAALNQEVVFEQSVSGSIYYNAADKVIFGGNASGVERSVNAYLDEFRFVKGKALLTKGLDYADPGQFPDS